MPSTGFTTAPRKFNTATNSFTANPVRQGLGNPPAPATGMKNPKSLGVPTRKSKRLLTPFDTGYGKERPFIKSPQVTEENY